MFSWNMKNLVIQIPTYMILTISWLRSSVRSAKDTDLHVNYQ